MPDKKPSKSKNKTTTPKPAAVKAKKPTAVKAKKLTSKPAAKTYRQICLSMYHEDLKALDSVVGCLKDQGVSGVSRSSVVRAAVALAPTDQLAKVLSE